MLTVRAGSETHADLLIQSLTAPHDKNTAEAVRFSMTLKSVRFVDSQTVAIQAAVSRAKTDGGKKATDKATEKEQNRSLLKQLVGGIAAALKKPGVQ